jgi:hypothetical protein
MTTYRTCDGVTRRDVLRVGALTGLGFGLSDYLALAKTGAPVGGSARAAIFVRMGGGPSHMDSFDMKPEAPDTHRGEFKEIPTNVPGIHICEHLPKLAACADLYAILRGVSHTLAAHELGTLYMGTGNRPIASLSYPSYGAVVAKELEGRPDLPSFVAIPNQDRASTGFLGVQYGPFETGPLPRAGQPIRIRSLALNGVPLEQVDRRQEMLKRYDTAFGDAVKDEQVLAGMDQFGQKAYEMMRSPRTREAFDVARESKAIADLFGADGFSQGCLLATRLVESGVRFVTVQIGGWDTHQDNFPRLKTNLLPSLDAGLSGLLRALKEKGLLETTTVFVTGEFGRTPKINQRGGRDHYPRAMFVVMAGGGIRGGQVVGASDEKGEGPKDRAISPDDVACTFYRTLGIDATQEYKTPSGRPVMIVRNGTVIPELIG